MKTLSVIIPCYNEADTIEKVIDIVNNVKIDKQIILVDDFSTDGTREIIKNKIESKVDTCIYLDHNQGKGACIKEGLKHVKGDAVIIQDADLEYDPNDYIKIVKPIFEGKTNVVYGSRYLNRKKMKGQKLNVLGNKFFNWLSNRLNKQYLSDANTCYICFNSELINKLDLKENGFAFNPEITAKFVKLNENIVEVPVTYHPRTVKEGKKIKFKDSFKHIKVMWKYRKPINKRTKNIICITLIAILAVFFLTSFIYILINNDISIYKK